MNYTRTTIYWVLQGLTREGKEEQFGKASTVYKTLTSLLREKSPAFAAAVEKQVLFNSFP